MCYKYSCLGDEIYFIKLVLFVFRWPTFEIFKIEWLSCLCVLCVFAVNKYISLKIQIII